ncbi:MAG: hypothetical protein J7K85_09020, partial [Anaerolineaceae bacterium]|nr:hypothetical protein [Anaerolineaceae bacterium]
VACFFLSLILLKTKFNWENFNNHVIAVPEIKPLSTGFTTPDYYGNTFRMQLPGCQFFQQQ